MLVSVTFQLEMFECPHQDLAYPKIRIGIQARVEVDRLLDYCMRRIDEAAVIQSRLKVKCKMYWYMNI